MKEKLKIAFVTSQGGHLGQIKIIFDKDTISDYNAILITESNDAPKVKERYFDGKYKTYFFKKDHLSFYPQRYLSTMSKIKRILEKEKIDLLVTNGAQISIPAVFASKLLGIPTIFLDTFIRVKTPNWSAKACYPFSDIFLVQHKNMIRKYGKKAKYLGSVL